MSQRAKLYQKINFSNQTDLFTRNKTREISKNRNYIYKENLYLLTT